MVCMACWLMAVEASAAHDEVCSPNGKVKVTVTTDDVVKWSVTYDGRTVLMPSEINIELHNATKEATDYQHIRQVVSGTDCLPIHLSSGGGWVAIIK